MTNQVTLLVVTLRAIAPGDLPIFFEHQQDPQAVYMAAFTAKDPTDRAALDAHWARILADPTTINRAILCDTQTAGHVSSYQDEGRPEVTYWVGRQWWGQGVATRALGLFLAQANTTRPIYARAATDNLGSLRVLERCGFAIIEHSRGFANARGMEIDEVLLKLEAGPPPTP